MIGAQFAEIMKAAESVIDINNAVIATAAALAAGICIFIVRHRDVFKAKK